MAVLDDLVDDLSHKRRVSRPLDIAGDIADVANPLYLSHNIQVLALGDHHLRSAEEVERALAPGLALPGSLGDRREFAVLAGQYSKDAVRLTIVKPP
jgi:hypothetical protein